MRLVRNLGWSSVAAVALLALGPTACCQPGLCVDPTYDAGPAIATNSDGGRSIQPTLSDIQTKVFALSCATSGCHDAANAVASGNLDLSSTSASFAGLVNATTYDVPGLTRVVPNHPETSFLVVKLVEMWDPNPPQTYGGAMPVGTGKLPADQLQAIQDWIADGAANN
jgi:hypothetical protein